MSPTTKNAWESLGKLKALYDGVLNVLTPAQQAELKSEINLAKAGLKELFATFTSILETFEGPECLTDPPSRIPVVWDDIENY